MAFYLLGSGSVCLFVVKYLKVVGSSGKTGSCWLKPWFLGSRDSIERAKRLSVLTNSADMIVAS